MHANLAYFDDLPDSALVPFSVASVITHEGESTLWRKAQTNPLLKPIRLGPKATRLNVGNLRRYMAGEQAA